MTVTSIAPPAGNGRGHEKNMSIYPTMSTIKPICKISLKESAKAF